jgi:hypothetical protein
MTARGTWGVWCEVWGGVTGRRRAWLKDDGRPAEFGSRAEAEAEARRLNASVGGNPRRKAQFRYSARLRPHLMEPCRFTFDDETAFDGFAYGSTWNGFDNVAVTAETFAEICEHFRRQCGGDERAYRNAMGEDWFALAPGDDGLISLGWGYATTIVREGGA